MSLVKTSNRDFFDQLKVEEFDKTLNHYVPIKGDHFLIAPRFSFLELALFMVEPIYGVQCGDTLI